MRLDWLMKREKDRQEEPENLSEKQTSGINERLLLQALGQEIPERAREEGRAAGFNQGSVSAALTCYAAAATVLRRDLHLDDDRIAEFLEEMNLAAATLARQNGSERETLGRIGVEAVPEAGTVRIVRKERRPVLCARCMMGDPVSSGAWDCDMIDSLTSGKRECAFYREDPDK